MVAAIFNRWLSLETFSLMACRVSEYVRYTYLELYIVKQHLVCYYHIVTLLFRDEIEARAHRVEYAFYIQEGWLAYFL